MGPGRHDKIAVNPDITFIIRPSWGIKSAALLDDVCHVRIKVVEARPYPYSLSSPQENSREREDRQGSKHPVFEQGRCTGCGQFAGVGAAKRFSCRDNNDTVDEGDPGEIPWPPPPVGEYACRNGGNGTGKCEDGGLLYANPDGQGIRTAGPVALDVLGIFQEFAGEHREEGDNGDREYRDKISPPGKRPAKEEDARRKVRHRHVPEKRCALEPGRVRDKEQGIEKGNAKAERGREPAGDKAEDEQAARRRREPVFLPTEPEGIGRFGRLIASIAASK